jgi:hypothetical protein
MAEPPFDPGVKEIDTVPEPTYVTTRLVGALGTVAMLVIL